jgi:hypothetical protein
MRRWLAVMGVLLGLEICLSVAQASKQSDPFHSYLSELRTGRYGTGLVRFATECGVNLKTIRPRYAQAPNNEEWKVVKNLKNALEDMSKDYYGTVTVWTNPRTVLVAYFGVDAELALGSQRRSLFCLANGKIQETEILDWEYFAGEDLNGPIKPHWLGYERRWKRNSENSYSTLLQHYVDRGEHSIAQPIDSEKSLFETDSFPSQFSWEDLKLPSTLLH